MKKIYKTLIWISLIALMLWIAYATVTVASLNKSNFLPWQWTRSWQFNTAHNVWSDYTAEVRFTDNLNGTISDSITGLMWQNANWTNEIQTCSWYDDINYVTDWWDSDDWIDYDDCNWEAAKAYCDNLILWWYTDWRVPNIKELSTTVDFSKYNYAIDSIFTSVSRYYWSSTEYVLYTYQAYWIDYYSWLTYTYNKNLSRAVRCVR